MSALDIAGAIIWTGLALFLWNDILFVAWSSEDNQITGCFIAVILSFASIYCIARCLVACAYLPDAPLKFQPHQDPQ